MPLYDYDCANCGRRFEAIHGVHADGPTACPLCGGGPVRKAITAAAVHFKGSGWAKKERGATATKASAKASGDAGASGDGGHADGGVGDATGAKKVAAKTEAATETGTAASSSD